MEAIILANNLRCILISEIECNENVRKSRLRQSAFGKKGQISSRIFIFLFLMQLCTIIWQVQLLYYYYFFCFIMIFFGLVRYGAIVWIPNNKEEKLDNICDDYLPIYSIIIALYQEANIIEQLIKNIENIDWPKDKLDIIFICEIDDFVTQEEIKKFANPNNSRLIILQNGSPKTKPRALNMGLEYAQGDLLTIYDAEDRPHPLQLKAAYSKFRSEGEALGVVQCPLVALNDKDSWISQIFSLDYAIWFRALLPFLAKITGFIPLGGTSNHFKTSQLRKLGGWDPYNVTEDADLGVKIARQGLKAKTIKYPTYEEAPIKLFQWIKQRTRWTKGHLQTIGVHFAKPLGLIKDVGLYKTIGIMAGILTGPLFISLRIPFLIFTLMNGDNIGILFFSFNLSISIVLEIALAIKAAAIDGRLRLINMVLLFPIYWFLQFIALLRAILQLYTNPYYWEKTQHGIGYIDINYNQLTSDSDNEEKWKL